MIINIKLDLDNEDDSYKFKMLTEGSNYLSVINRTQECLRNLKKHSGLSHVNIDRLYKEWWEILQEEEVNPYN